MTEPFWTVDTNVLVYALSPEQPAEKQLVAQKMLAKLALPGGCLAGQVLGEFMSVILRKSAKTHAQAMQTLALLSAGVPVLGASSGTYAQAWALVGQHHYQVWDALIIAVCAEHGIKTLYSEDTGSLKRPLGVQVVNPF
jgi:predicted nucleic acid-binding protein